MPLNRLIFVAWFMCLSFVPAQEQVPSQSPSTPPAADPVHEQKAEDVPLPDGKTVPPIEKVNDDCVKIGEVVVNHKERTIHFTAQVNMNEGIVEYLCCMPNGKVHESFLVSNADPLHISLGMTLLKFHRFEKFFPMRDENFEWLPFTEPKPQDYADSHVQLEATYTLNGKEYKTVFTDLIFNLKTRQGLGADDWLYTNSFFYEGAYQASMTGEIISIFASRTSLINYIGEFRHGDNNAGWYVDGTKKLPLGLEFRICISQKSLPERVTNTSAAN